MGRVGCATASAHRRQSNNHIHKCKYKFTKMCRRSRSCLRACSPAHRARRLPLLRDHLGVGVCVGKGQGVGSETREE